MSRPISSIASTAKPSSSPARTPTESTKMRWPWSCFNMAAAIGERKAFWVQQNSTAPGSASAIVPRPPRLAAEVQRADQREQPTRGVEVDLDLAFQAFPQHLRTFVVQAAPAHVDRLDLRRRGGADRAVVAVADLEIILHDPAERRERQDEAVEVAIPGVADIDDQAILLDAEAQMIGAG